MRGMLTRQTLTIDYRYRSVAICHTSDRFVLPYSFVSRNSVPCDKTGDLLFDAHVSRVEGGPIVLNKPGSLYYPRYNQLDVNFKKNFRTGRRSYRGQIDLFNALNGRAIFTRNNSIGNSLGQVQSILQGRIVRLAFQFKF